MSDLLELASLCEAAEGPDRGLDWQIHVRDGLVGVGSYGPHPTYTASIDAAMSLLPDTTDLTMGRVWCIRRFAHITDGEQTWSGEAVTEALALCAAALRARAVHKAEKEG